MERDKNIGKHKHYSDQRGHKERGLANRWRRYLEERNTNLPYGTVYFIDNSQQDSQLAHQNPTDAD